MTANDNGWIEILASAVVGMFAGLIADPVRSIVENRIEARRFRNAVLWDIATLSDGAVRVYEGKLEAWKTLARCRDTRFRLLLAKES